MSMGMRPGKATMNASGMTMTQLVEMLANQVDRPIVDGTGLTGKYDFTLEFAPEMRNMPSMPMMAGGGPVTEGESAPSLFTAVQEQLGLKMQDAKDPVEMLIIDHMEKPDAN